MLSQIEKFNKRYGKEKINTEQNLVKDKNIEVVTKEIVTPSSTKIELTANEKLLNLIIDGATIQELKQELKLNNYQLSLKLNSLKNKGFLIEKTYNDDIGTKISLQQNSGQQKIKDNIRIYTNDSTDKIRFVIIADTHFGNIGDRFDLIESIYEYAIKHGIHSILHLGDLIEGFNPRINNIDRLKMTDAIETAKYVTKNYPKDNSITNYILLGNHDFRTICTQGFDISTLISNARLDMEFLGYKNATIELRKDSIGLQHPTTIENHHTYDFQFKQYYKDKLTKPLICFRGHLHNSLFYTFQDITIVCAPLLYNSTVQKPLGAWDIILYFNSQNKIENIELQPLVVEPKVTPTTKILHKIR